MHDPESDPHRPDDRPPVVIVVVTVDPLAPSQVRGVVARSLRVLAVLATPALAILRYLGVL